MRLSTFLLFDRDPDAPPDAAGTYHRGLELCELAEDLGLDGVWVAEHHFRDFGALPNPAVFLAAVAQRTKRIRLGPAVAVLPFHSPIAIAEDYALVDRLSGGRLNMGVGSGILPFEFDGFGIDPSEKRARFDETLQALEGLWTGSNSECAGQFIDVAGVGLNIAPVQSPMPPLYVATTQPAGALAVGRSGRHLLTIASASLPSLDHLARTLEAYRRGITEGGHDRAKVHAAVNMFANVAESDDLARAHAAGPLGRFVSCHGDAVGIGGEALFDRMMERRTALFGSPSRVAATMNELAEMGADEVILWMSFGGMEIELIARSIRCMVAMCADQKIRPRVRSQFVQEQAVG